ncbi:MAG: GNAT family N-acetyltransferase [Pseudomonadota bacterium]|nr:GNAT family N-acetyltransferase [Pseudomonadota bacterium]
MHIRRARDEDIPALRAIAADAYAQYVEAIGRKPAPMIDRFLDRLAQDIVFVAMMPPDHRVVGYAVLVKKADGFWLESIAVSSASAGQGIGTGLIAHVEAYLAGRTASYRLYTNVKMTRNIGWYERRGFVETGRGVENGFERVYFRKVLTL